MGERTRLQALVSAAHKPDLPGAGDAEPPSAPSRRSTPSLRRDELRQHQRLGIRRALSPSKEARRHQRARARRSGTPPKKFAQSFNAFSPHQGSRSAPALALAAAAFHAGTRRRLSVHYLPGKPLLSPGSPSPMRDGPPRGGGGGGGGCCFLAASFRFPLGGNGWAKGEKPLTRAGGNKLMSDKRLNGSSSCAGKWEERRVPSPSPPRAAICSASGDSLAVPRARSLALARSFFLSFFGESLHFAACACLSPF